MMQLLAWTVLQSALAVGGMALLTHALHGVPLEVRALSTAFLSLWALAGVAALAASFVVLSIILSFASWSTFIPISTACTFVCTICLSMIIQTEAVSIRTVIGMVLIIVGVAVIASKRTI